MNSKRKRPSVHHVLQQKAQKARRTGGESRRACRGPGRNGATTRRTRQPCTGGGKRLTTSPAAGPLGRRGALLAGKMASFQSLGSSGVVSGRVVGGNALVHKGSGCLRGNH